MALKIEDGRLSFYQWDLDQRLLVTDKCTEVHFCNGSCETSMVCKTYEDNGALVVNVPNILLQEDKPFDCFTYVKNENGSYTSHKTSFKVKTKKKPTDYIYTETELYTVEKIVEQAIQDAKDSGDFKGDKGDTPEKGVDYFTQDDITEMVNATIKALPVYSGEVVAV